MSITSPPPAQPSRHDKKAIGKHFAAWIKNGLLVIAPFIVLGFVYHTFSGDIQGFVGGPATDIGQDIGLSHSLAASAPFACLVALVAVIIIGAFFATRPGAFLIGKFDQLCCKIGFYRAIRKLIKLPAPKVGNLPTPPDDGSQAVWSWIGGGWDLFGVRCSAVGTDGTTFFSLWQLSVPMPTGFSERWVNAAHTGKTNMSFAQATAYRESGGGPLPEGALLPPDEPPSFARDAANG